MGGEVLVGVMGGGRWGLVGGSEREARGELPRACLHDLGPSRHVERRDVRSPQRRGIRARGAAGDEQGGGVGQLLLHPRHRRLRIHSATMLHRDAFHVRARRVAPMLSSAKANRISEGGTEGGRGARGKRRERSGGNAPNPPCNRAPICACSPSTAPHDPPARYLECGRSPQVALPREGAATWRAHRSHSRQRRWGERLRCSR